MREGRDSVGRRLIDVPDYSFRVFVTRCDAAPEEIWRDYNRRADMENRIAELKHDLGARLLHAAILRHRGGFSRRTTSFQFAI